MLIICKTLKGIESLTSIELRIIKINHKSELNKIGKDGAKVIVDHLNLKAQITNLNLGWNNIEDDGAIIIANSLVASTKIQYLSFGK